VILDEPITGLDVRHQMEVLELLKKEVDECQLTVVATLHDLTLAGHFADQLVLLDHGLVRANGTSSDVLRSPALSEAYEMQLRVLSVDGADVIIPVR
jgi:iron complex transport system ATP-binding protein